MKAKTTVPTRYLHFRAVNCQRQLCWLLACCVRYTVLGVWLLIEAVSSGTSYLEFRKVQVSEIPLYALFTIPQRRLCDWFKFQPLWKLLPCFRLSHFLKNFLIIQPPNMFESSDRPQKVKQSSTMGESKHEQQQQKHSQPNVSADHCESSLISSSSSCSRSHSSSSNKEKPPPASPVPSTNQTPATTTTTATTSITQTADDTTISSSSPLPSQDQDNQRSFLAIVQTQLAWQLAYYFSPANLAADAYLKTLQNLNDGCVPVNILANFGKIQTILSVTPCLRRVYQQDESARVQVLVHAVQLNPDCGLQVVQVNANTGKVVNTNVDDVEKDDDKLRDNGAADNSNIRTLLAIRPVPTTQAAVVAAATSTSSSSCCFTNCVLLRDVNPSVTEADVQELLERLKVQQQEDGSSSSFCCPPVLRIQCDVAQCWYVLLLIFFSLVQTHVFVCKTLT